MSSLCGRQLLPGVIVLISDTVLTDDATFGCRCVLDSSSDISVLLLADRQCSDQSTGNPRSRKDSGQTFQGHLKCTDCAPHIKKLCLPGHSQCADCAPRIKKLCHAQIDSTVPMATAAFRRYVCQRHGAHGYLGIVIISCRSEATSMRHHKRVCMLHMC